ncbi:MAG: alpha/beta fold hydrolase [Halomonadaceae bacterium]|nr:MAG: alpha/beta fold hydrolase [Halomonadaceae bacterium]
MSYRPLLQSLTLLVLVLAGIAGCASPGDRFRGDGEPAPRLEPQQLIAHDGYRLLLHHWTVDEPRAVVLALHGFNDHGGGFSAIAKRFNDHQVSLYAYDQRGFGGSEPRGFWPGHELLAQDALTAAGLLRQRYPQQPVYLLGKSMGGAVAMLAVDAAPEAVNGSLLVAPAVWSRDTMPWYQRFSLWLGSSLAPGATLPSSLGGRLGIRASDDNDMLRALGQDPMMLHGARIGTVSGLATLMDRALAASSRIPGPALILYGDNDQVIPAPPMCRMVQQLPLRQGHKWRMILYPDGYHMLTRYSGTGQVVEDMLAWLEHPGITPLPSGHEVSRVEAKTTLCD